MCVHNLGPIETATTEMRAFKVVMCKSAGNFVSQFQPGQRIPQYKLNKMGQKIPAHDPGVEVTYQLGEVARSDLDTTPGLYTFVERDTAGAWANDHESVLEVSIPTGTRYRTATAEMQEAVLLVEELIPVRVVRRKLNIL